MATTTNFGWETPDDTDLVKDGALAIRTLGSAIDTSLVDLKGGTTGQILSKASNTDLDYTWINNDQGDITAVTAGTGLTGGGTTGAVTLTNDMATTITAAGDIVVGTGSGTYDNLPIGTTGQVLTADTTVSPYKVKWASASGGGMTSIASGSLSGSTTTISSISGSYNNLVLFIRDYSSDDNTGDLQIRFNNDTTANYHLMAWQQCEVASPYQDGQNVNTYYFTATGAAKAADNNNSLVLNVYDYATSGIRKNAEFWNSVVAGGGSNAYLFKSECGYQGTDAITRIDLLLDAGSFDGGTYVLYGVK